MATLPARALPRDVPDPVDRRDEIDAATAALQGGRSVEIVGEAGIGKSTLLRHLAHRLAAHDGVVHGSARNRTADDLLQYLFDRVFRTVGSHRPTPGQLHDALAGVRVVYALDDVELSGDEVGRLLDGAPAAVLLLASRDSVLAGAGETVRLRGLPTDAAVALLERHLGRSLSDEDAAAARTLAENLEGHPGRLIQAAARARDEAVSLADLASEASSTAISGRGPSIGAVDLSELPDADRRVVAVMAALRGAPVRAEHIEAITGVLDLDEVLGRLRRGGVIAAASPSFTLTEEAGPEAERFLLVATWRERVVEHFLGWARPNRDDTGRLLRSLDALLATMEVAWAAGRRRDYLTLAALVEEPLLIDRRWGTWGAILRRSLEAAEIIGDPAAQALAHHELGTRALGEGRRGEARAHLRRARSLRRAAGDREGLRLTRHNLRLVSPAPWYAVGGGGAVVAAVVAGALLLPGAGVAASPDPVTFGEHQIEGDAEFRTVTLRATGDPVSITGISIAPPLADLSVRGSRGCMGRLVEPCRVRIVFEPRTAGRIEASLVVAHDGDDSPTTVPIEATGIPPPGKPAIGLEPESVEFGAVPVGETSVETVTVTNEGGAPLRVREPILTYTAGPEDAFEVDATGCTSAPVPVGEDCPIEISFLHPTRGDVEVELEVRSNAAGGPHVVPLSGRTALPDLIAAVQQTDEPEVGEISVRVEMTISVVNQGDVAAAPFFVAVATAPEGHFVATTSEIVEAEPPYARVLQPLSAAEGENLVLINGYLVVPRSAQISAVEVHATADACVGSDQPPECAVVELNEENNRSARITIELPTDQPTVSPTTPPANGGVD